LVTEFLGHLVHRLPRRTSAAHRICEIKKCSDLWGRLQVRERHQRRTDRRDSIPGEAGDPYTETIYDPEGRTSVDYGVYGAPESFLIDKKGVVRFKQVGPITDQVWYQKISSRWPAN
jgi:hypothetical protein